MTTHPSRRSEDFNRMAQVVQRRIGGVAKPIELDTVKAVLYAIESDYLLVPRAGLPAEDEAEMTGSGPYGF